MSEQEKKQQRVYDLLNAETKLKFLCRPYTKQNKNFIGKEFLRKRWGGEGMNKKRKSVLTVFAAVIKKDPPHH